MRRSLAGALLAGALFIAASAVLLVAGAGPAGAHTDTGTFSATRAEPNGTGSFTIDLLLTYDNDGHGAEGASLTVTVQGPTGGPVPVTMAPGDRAGAYTGDVPVETTGEYTVTASSTEPVAETTFTFAVAEMATTTTSTAEATTTTTDDETTVTTAGGSDGADDDRDGEGEGNLASIVVNGLLLIGGATGAFFAIRWWRNRGSDTSPS